MDITKSNLEETFRGKGNDELLDIHAQGTLTELANQVLEAELASRGLLGTAESKVNIDNGTKVSTKQRQRKTISGRHKNAAAYVGALIGGGVLWGLAYYENNSSAVGIKDAGQLAIFGGLIGYVLTRFALSLFPTKNDGAE